MKKAVAIGELLIDFVPQQQRLRARRGRSSSSVWRAARRPMWRRQWRGSAAEAQMISQVGEDAFGTHILKVAACGKRRGHFLGVSAPDRANTALAFVSLDASGQPRVLLLPQSLGRPVP